MRPLCIDCTRKHLGAALVLMQEARLGYPEHKWLAVGHLVEAEAESTLEWGLLIREQRLEYIAGGDGSGVLGILSKLSVLSSFEQELPF